VSFRLPETSKQLSDPHSTNRVEGWVAAEAGDAMPVINIVARANAWNRRMTLFSF
jgi:hypothetical protein